VNSVTVWRLCTTRYAATAFDGEGSRRFGGRWSPIGLALTYTSESRALAMLEVLVNAEDPENVVDLAWVFITAEVPAELIEKPARVPEDWRVFPHTAAVQEFGAAWAREQRSPVLRVPSAVVPGEFNYLLNPAHPDFKRVKLGKPEPFSFDPRLAK
jgi:RES domain-containing protein